MKKTDCPRSFWGKVGHDWGPWEIYDWQGEWFNYETGQRFPIAKERQRRQCKRCGFTQDVAVRDDCYR